MNNFSYITYFVLLLLDILKSLQCKLSRVQLQNESRVSTKEIVLCILIAHTVLRTVDIQCLEFILQI